MIYESLFLYLAVISSFPVLMGAIRLARFNVGHTQESKQNYFVGLPSPMSAITICSIVLLKLKLDPTINENEFMFNLKNINIFDLNIILPIIILLSFLMIGKIHFSKFPLFSFSHSYQNTIRLFLLIISFIILIITKINDYFHIGLFIFSSYYILSNILFHFINNSIKLNQLRETLKKKKRKL